MTNSETNRSATYWPALDGMRGLAILLVIGGHTSLLPKIAGALGVTVFFVLSGFLITTVLMGREQSLREFYGARAFRLLPAITVMLAVLGIVWLVQGRPVGVFLEEAGAALFYVENFFHGAHDGGFVSHTWSLSVEEQFYLLWPWLLPFVLGLGLRTRALVMFGAAAAFAILRLGLSLGTSFDDFVYASLPTNAYAMLLGCAVAVLPRFVGARLALVAAGLAAIAAVVAFGGALPGGGITAPVVAAGGALLLLSGALQGNAALELQPLRFVGRVSYAWYLWHWPLLWLTGDLSGGISAVPVAAGSFMVAVVSTIWFEEPVRRWWRAKAQHQRSTPTVSESSRI